MDFLKKHYEKVLLGVVLVGLAVAVALLPIKAASEKQDLENKRLNISHRPVTALSNLDLTLADEAVKKLSTPPALDFSTTNRLFNPRPWQKTKPPDEHLIPADEFHTGPNAVVITKITPLNLILSLEEAKMSADTNGIYTIGVIKEASPNSKDWSRHTTFCKLNEKKDIFTVVEVKGKPDDPTQVVLRLHDSGERAAIAKGKPFTRTDGYKADLKYPIESGNWLNRRENSQPPLRFNNEEYNIVAIHSNDVVLLAKSNQKKWTIKYNPAPEPR